MNFFLANSLYRYTYLLSLFYIYLTVFLSRTGSGIYLLGFRIGEIVVGGSILLSILILVVPDEDKFVRNIKSILSVYLLSFIFFNFYYQSDFLNLFIYRSSTYIWFIVFVVIGMKAKKLVIPDSNYKYFYLFLLYLFFLGIFQTEALISTNLASFTDKIELHKGSEITLIFVLFFFVHNNFRKRNLKIFYIFLSFSSLYLPFLMYKSRASFIATLVFVIFELFLFSREIKINLKFLATSFILSIAIGTFSTVLSQNYLIPDYESFPELIKASYSTIISDRYATYDNELPFVYFEDGRMFTADGNLNWRIQMWQDMFSYIFENPTSLYLGIGYSEIFPVFDTNLFGDAKYRLGLDGLNLHLHNFFLTIFSRGGIIHLFLIILFFVLIFRKYFEVYKNYKILIIFISIFFVSFFDSSMENAHFPVIFYFFIGNQLINKSKL